MRDQLKAGMEKAYGAIWGGGTVDPALLTVGPPLAGAQAISDISRRFSQKPTRRRRRWRPPTNTPAWSNNRGS